MSKAVDNRHKAVLTFIASALLLWSGTALGALLLEADKDAPVLSTLLEGSGDTQLQPLISDTELVESSYLSVPLANGQWTSACARATHVLAKQQASVDALGIFAMCAAIRNDTKVVNTALKRLKEAEPPPHYYAQLTEGILLLRSRTPDKAGAAFKSILQQRANDPLAFYFAGEASHAQGKNADAIAYFKSSLKAWPNHAPAHSALARLTVSGNASKSALQSAIASAEQATKIDPANRGYWKQLANLCERAGETGRANAIRLQWLTPRIPK